MQPTSTWFSRRRWTIGAGTCGASSFAPSRTAGGGISGRRFPWSRSSASSTTTSCAIDPAKPAWRERDRFILSKGHGCLALYAVLADKGFFDVGELDRFCHFDSFLGGHPETVVPGVEACTGALGHGLSIGLGMALAARMTGRDSKVYVLMGDGEINEGSVWEAAACADKHRLSNLTAIIDYNKIQSAGSVFEIQNMEPLADKWTAFGFRVFECNGHDVDDLRQVFREAAAYAGDRPRAVICHTVKGKGIPAAENNPDWHHKSDLKPAELQIVRSALGS